MKRALWIGGSFIVIAIVGCLSVLASLYVSAAPQVSRALAEVPVELRPPPKPFVRAALCVHANGVSQFAARRLLVASGNTGGRAVAWAARYFVWTKAVQWRSADEGLGLFANTMIHKAGSGLSLGAQVYFGKSAAELTSSEALDLVLADAYPRGLSPVRLDRFRQRCS